MSDWPEEETSEAPWPRATPNNELPDTPADMGTTGTEAVSRASRARALRERQIAERATLLDAHKAELRDAGFEDETPVKTFAPVNINVDLGELMQYFGMEYDEDGPTGNPNQDIRNQIMNMVADKLVAKALGSDTEFKGRLSNTINVRLGTILDKALQRQFQPVDWSGQPKGDPTTLNEIIGEQARKFLAEAVAAPGQYDRGTGHKGRLDKFIKDELGRQWEGELKVAMTDAKTVVLKAVTEKGAEFLTQAFADAAGKVQASTGPSKTIGGTI